MFVPTAGLQQDARNMNWKNPPISIDERIAKSIVRTVDGFSVDEKFFGETGYFDINLENKQGITFFYTSREQRDELLEFLKCSTTEDIETILINYMSQISQENFQSQRSLPMSYADFKDAYYSFTNAKTTLEQVFAKIAEYYDVSIEQVEAMYKTYIVES